MKYFKLKLLLLFFALAAAMPPAWAETVTDVLNREFTGVTGNSYTTWSDKTGTSGAVYSGNSAGGNDAIQLRATSGSAIVTTKSGGKVKSITVTWNSNTANGRTLNIYCSNTAYTLAGFANDASNLSPVGTIVYGTSTSLNINDDYNYIAIKSANGAQYIEKIEIVWEVPDADEPVITVDPTSLTINDNNGDNKTGTLTATLTNGQGDLTAVTNPSDKWSWANNTVTFNGKELGATGTVTFSSTGANNVSANLEYNYTGPLYILGYVNGGDWSANNMVEMEGPDADGIYTATFATTPNANNESEISFSKRKGSDWNQWGEIYEYRFVPVSNGAWGLTDGTLGGWHNLDFEPSHVDGQKIVMPAGTYTVSIDAKNNKFKIERYVAPVTTQYVKVTSTDQLVAGKKYIFVHEGYSGAYTKVASAMGALGSDNFGTPIAITVNSDGSVTAGEDVLVFTLGGTSNDYTFTFPDGSTVLQGPNGTSFSTSTNATNEIAKWRINNYNGTLDGFRIVNNKNTSRAIRRSTNSYDRYGHYSTSDQNSEYAFLYVKSDGETPTETVATPTITPASGNYKTPQSVTITCATEGAEIRYTTDGSDPDANSTPYTGAITVNTPEATTTIKAIGVKADLNSSGIATATYTLPKAVDNLAAANALAPTTGNNGVDFFFTGDVVVTYASGDYIWLRDVDATAGGGLFYKTGIEVTTPGAVLSQNWGATAKQYRGLIEFTSAEGVANSGNTAPYAPFDRTGVALTDAHMNEYIVFNNVRIDSKDDDNKTYTATYVGENREAITYQLYDQFGKSPEVGKTYNITGLVTKYNDIQVYPTYLEEVPQVATPTFSPNGGEFTAAQEVTISCATENAKIYYSLDRENWTEGTTLTVDRSGKVYAKATKANMQDSEVAEATFTINYPAITVTLEPETETYTVGDEAKVKVTVANTVGTATVTYMTGETAETANTPVTPDEDGYITIPTTEAGTVVLKVTASDAYHAEPVIKTGTYTIEPRPYVTAEPTSLDFEAVIGNDPVEKTFTVMAENLKEGITLTLSETEVFTIDPTTITMGDMTDDGVVVTVTYNPTAVTGDNFDEAKITIKSTDAEDVTVTLTGMATLPDPVLNVSTEELEMGTDPTGTFTVTGQHLTEDVTLTVTEGTAANFVITPANITPDEEGKVNQEITVTYKGTSTTDELATITVASGNASKDVIVSARVLPTPELIADPESLTMTAVVGQTPATATFTVMATDLRGDITLTLSETDAFTINPATIAKAGMTEDGVEVTVTYTPTQAGNDNATITIASEAAESVTVTLNGTATVPEVVAAPTFSLVAGSYTGAQTVTISCATESATILYSTDGGSTWTAGNTVNVDKDMTIMAKAEKDGYTNSATVTAAYIIDIPEELPTIEPFKGYYQIKNNENNKYANIAGRRTLTFTDAPADKAGTVIWLETNDKGQVQSIRSQAADLQGYANRAMRYVPQMVQLVADKLHAEGAGTGILGENGLDAIMDKFNECFDYHLYVEEAQGGWRLYGKTPSMQHVVDFYREHTVQVEEKLPMLEQFINDALTKLRNKVGGSSIFTPFSLHQIWDKMGRTLTEPNDAESTMAFYREVLNNKNYVWDFAYQTAQIYWNNVKDHPRYAELKAQLGEYADYIDEFVNQVRPDFKYYVIQRGDEPDYISEGNGEIINNDPRTIWTIEDRETFRLNSAGELFGCPLNDNAIGGYFTTNYTDFAYTLPEGVTAYKVTSVDEDGEAKLEALSGIIPAQTPVLLVAEKDGAYEVTLTNEAATADTTGNLLVGPDYLIKLYQFKTPMVVDLFTFAQGILGVDLYNEYVKPYEYLQLRYAGTVNNKYFWNVNSDLDDITGINVLRSLSTQTGELAFSDQEKTENNKAFMVSETFDAITLPSLKRGDVNHDGVVNIQDVTDLIDRLLKIEGLACPYCSDVNSSGAVNIEDVTDLIDIYLLGKSSSQTQEPGTGE